MTETERKATFCTQCGQEVGAAKFCPNCGAKVETIPIGEPPTISEPEGVSISNPASESKPARPTVKERWHALPMWRKVVPIATIVVGLIVRLAIPVSNVIEDAQRKARIEAREAEEAAEAAAAEELQQKQRQELIDLWNAYAAHDLNGPTKGRQLTVDMVADRVDFGSGWVEFYAYDGQHISLYYHAEQLISEADISALGAIFSNETETQKLVRELQAYNASIRDRKERPHGADLVDFEVDFNTKDIVELEFSDPYTRYLNSPPGDAYYSNQVSDESYFSIAQQIVSYGLKAPSSAQYSDMSIEEVDTQGRRLITMAVDAENTFGAMVRNYYAIIVQKADTKGNFSYNPNFAAQEYSVAQKSNVIAIMKRLNRWDLPMEAYEYDGPDIAQEPQNGNSASKDSANSNVTQPNTPANESAPRPKMTLPFVARVTDTSLHIYSGPGMDYQDCGSLDLGSYTIVETSAGQGAELWGKLKSGAGWIALDTVQPVLD